MARAVEAILFRAAPAAAELLTRAGVDCLTLANNHALDYGTQALLDTMESLASVEIPCVGAAVDVAGARAPRMLCAGGVAVAVLDLTDHPSASPAGPAARGIAHAALRATFSAAGPPRPSQPRGARPISCW